MGLGLLALPAVMSFAGKCWSHRRRSQADRPRFSSPTLGYVIESAFDTLRGMSTKDQLLCSAFHGTAMRYTAERRSLEGARALDTRRVKAGMRFRKGGDRLLNGFCRR